MIQRVGEKGFCSSVGDIEKHEKFKELSQEERIAKLQEVYDEYGVLSEEFFVQVKPFIMWTVYRYLRGMHYTNLEDLVNNAYEELVIAFNGGWTTHYNKMIYKEPTYQNDEYFTKYNNIGEYIMYVVGSSVAKYRAKNFRKQVVHEDTEYDISDRLNFTDFETNNDLGYTITEPEEVEYFKTFTFNEAFKQHLNVIRETQPRNNVVYNYLIWAERESKRA